MLENAKLYYATHEVTDGIRPATEEEIHAFYKNHEFNGQEVEATSQYSTLEVTQDGRIVSKRTRYR